MERTAYLVAHFDTSSGTPVFVDAGIYSASARGLTCAIGTKAFAFDVLEASAADYERAIARLCQWLTDPFTGVVYRWAITPRVAEECTRYGFPPGREE